jgi:dihydropteroate synthase
MEGDVVPQVLLFVTGCGASLQALGWQKRRRIVLDPGIGFGKTVAQNFSLLAASRAAGRRATRAGGLVAQVVAGRGDCLPVAPAAACGWPSVAAAVLAVERGARIVRVHDVRETVQALAVWAAMREQAAMDSHN